MADRGPTQVAAATGRGDALADVCPNLVGSTSSEGPGSRGSKAGLGLSQDEAGPPLGQVAGVAGSDGGLGKVRTGGAGRATESLRAWVTDDRDCDCVLPVRGG